MRERQETEEQARASKASSELRTALHAAVRRAALLMEDPAHITEQPIFPGASTTEKQTRPLTRLQAATWLRGFARDQERTAVTAARSAGVPWEEIAKVMDLPDGDQAAEAYRATVETGWSERLYFDCGSCGGGITDYGPYASHPTDREDGHTETCERHRAAVAAFERTIQ